MPITSLQPGDLSQRLAAGPVVLIDVRSPASCCAK